MRRRVKEHSFYFDFLIISDQSRHFFTRKGIRQEAIITWSLIFLFTPRQTRLISWWVSYYNIKRFYYFMNQTKISLLRPISKSIFCSFSGYAYFWTIEVKTSFSKCPNTSLLYQVVFSSFFLINFISTVDRGL